VSVSTVSDRDTRLMSHFWRSLQGSLGTRLKFNTSYYPQTDGQLERTIQILEDILRACMLDFKVSWDVHQHLAEFSYNNSYPLVLRWHPLKRCMRESVGLLCAEMILITTTTKPVVSSI